eukprot:SAG22_NODE_257_length_13543_cov_26.100417_2_plen_427_part_00
MATAVQQEVVPPPNSAPGPDWSIKALKDYIEANGGSHAGMVEKAELVGAARQLQASTGGLGPKPAVPPRVPADPEVAGIAAQRQKWQEAHGTSGGKGSGRRRRASAEHTIDGKPTAFDGSHHHTPSAPAPAAGGPNADGAAGSTPHPHVKHRSSHRSSHHHRRGSIDMHDVGSFHTAKPDVITKDELKKFHAESEALIKDAAKNDRLSAAEAARRTAKFRHAHHGHDNTDLGAGGQIGRSKVDFAPDLRDKQLPQVVDHDTAAAAARRQKLLQELAGILEHDFKGGKSDPHFRNHVRAAVGACQPARQPAIQPVSQPASPPARPLWLEMPLSTGYACPPNRTRVLVSLACAGIHPSHRLAITALAVLAGLALVLAVVFGALLGSADSDPAGARTRALSFCCASTVFLAKTVPFRAVLLSQVGRRPC